MTEQEETLQYLDENAIVKPEAFASTRKGGYLEETVDAWVSRAVESQEKLVNDYNNIVWRANTAEARVKELEAQINTTVTSPIIELTNELEPESENLIPVDAPEFEITDTENSTPIEEVNTDSRLESFFNVSGLPPVAPVTDGRNVNAELEEAHATITQLQDEVRVLDEEIKALKEEPAPATVVDFSNVSPRVREILDSASAEASEHVNRSLESVDRIEREAREEAERLLSDATTEAEDIKRQAVTDVKDAREELQGLKTERKEVLGRLVKFHENELNIIHELVVPEEDNEENL